MALHSRATPYNPLCSKQNGSDRLLVAPVWQPQWKKNFFLYSHSQGRLWLLCLGQMVTHPSLCQTLWPDGWVSLIDHYEKSAFQWLIVSLIPQRVQKVSLHQRNRQRRQETILREQSTSVGLAGDNGQNWRIGKAKRGQIYEHDKKMRRYLEGKRWEGKGDRKRGGREWWERRKKKKENGTETRAFFSFSFLSFPLFLFSFPHHLSPHSAFPSGTSVVQTPGPCRELQRLLICYQ